MAISSDTTGSQLLAAAFGEDPGQWPLPAAQSSYQLWLRAVAAGGQGRYGCALTDLATLRRDCPAGPLASLAHSTWASFLRQLGGHRAARGRDGRAWALAGDHLESGVDALIGLAADALGLRRFAASAALLCRARSRLGPAAPDRLPLRCEWVAAELAMVSGDGASAVRHAERAVELAAMSTSARHRVKTGVIAAAALCSAGKVDRARRQADDVLADTERFGLVPLRWATASLLADIGSNMYTAVEIVAVRDAAAAEVARAGGIWHR